MDSLKAIGGYDVETMGKPLDPLMLSKYIPAETLRKHETVHCRVAMLACVGYAFPREYLISACSATCLVDAGTVCTIARRVGSQQLRHSNSTVGVSLFFKFKVFVGAFLPGQFYGQTD